MIQFPITFSIRFDVRFAFHRRLRGLRQLQRPPRGRGRALREARKPARVQRAAGRARRSAGGAEGPEQYISDPEGSGGSRQVSATFERLVLGCLEADFASTI